LSGEYVTKFSRLALSGLASILKEKPVYGYVETEPHHRTMGEALCPSERHRPSSAQDFLQALMKREKRMSPAFPRVNRISSKTHLSKNPKRRINIEKMVDKQF
jgi:hypothetical protein